MTTYSAENERVVSEHHAEHNSRLSTLGQTVASPKIRCPGKLSPDVPTGAWLIHNEEHGAREIIVRFRNATRWADPGEHFVALRLGRETSN